MAITVTSGTVTAVQATGLAAGLEVDFTDRAAAALWFVEQSARANRHDRRRWSIGPLDWRNLPDRTYPLILGADILYERALVPLVANLIARLLAPGGEAWIAGPYRVATEDLGPVLTRHGLAWSSDPVEAANQAGRTYQGTLHRITHLR